MGLFNKKEDMKTVEFEDALLRAMFDRECITKEKALQIPTVSGGVDLIANVIASTPIKLYKDEGGKAYEISEDSRLGLLNDDTGDTLNSNEFWKAMVRDYFLGKGGYAYIHKERNKVRSLHYVDEEKISIKRSTDPIFKEYTINISGKPYYPFQFLKILRNTRDGAEGIPITKENSLLIEVAYESLNFELSMIKRGGNKKGFLRAEKKLDQTAIEALKRAFNNLYTNKADNMVILNNGMEFKECSDTSTEMQMNENKTTNAGEFAKLFHISTDVITGKSSEQDSASLAKLAAIPLMSAIECALNRDLLLEKEKKDHYFAFDTKELLKGDMKERFDAYKVALEANFMQIDEVRYAEDLEPLGLNWLKLGLQDVLYDPKTKTIYTPNTNSTSSLGNSEPGALKNDENYDIISEERANKNHDPKTGRFANRTSKTSGKSNKKEFTKAEKEAYLKEIKGKKTSNGITIKSMSKHAFQRAAERGITAKILLETVAEKANPSRDKTANYFDSDTKRVVINKHTGNIVTIMKIGEN